MCIWIVTKPQFVGRLTFSSHNYHYHCTPIDSCFLLVKASKNAGSKDSRSIDLGQYSRMSPLVFSLVPRIQGECGGGKKKGTSLRAAEISACLANSLPRSGVMERTSSGGRALSNRIIPSRTCTDVFLGIFKDSSSLDFLHARVIRQEEPVFPATVSASQCPSSERSLAA